MGGSTVIDDVIINKCDIDFACRCLSHGNSSGISMLLVAAVIITKHSDKSFVLGL